MEYPPSYSHATLQHSSLGCGLTFVDFLPPCMREGTLFSSPEYEPFGTLIACANEWLSLNPSWEVKTCESVEFKSGSLGLKVEQMTYLEYGKGRTHYMRCLRLWIVPRSDESRPPQKLDYINLVPNVVDSGGIFGSPKYETLHEMLHRYNIYVRTHPAPGRILAVESQEMKANSVHGFNPDRSFWHEPGEVNKFFLFVIRIFFEVGSFEPEAVGVADFHPDEIQEGGWFSTPLFEPFTKVISKASTWCAEQDSVRFCNAQTLEIKYKSGRGIDSHGMSYTEHGQAMTFYVRILRIAFTKRLQGEIPRSPRLNLQCKTFVPVQLKLGFRPQFESLTETKGRVEAWIRATGARVVSCETPAMRLSWASNTLANVNRSDTTNHGKRAEHWIFVIRVYLDGNYRQPPPEELPPVPELEEDKCCCVL